MPAVERSETGRCRPTFLTGAARALVFDMDGVVLDTERLYWEAEGIMLARRGRVFTPELAAKIMGLPSDAAMRMLTAELDLPDDPATLGAEASEEFLALLPTKLAFMPGFADFLDALDRAGMPLGLATSTNRPLAEKMLRQMNVLHRFRAVVTRDDVTSGKPHPEPFQRACELLGVPPAEAAAIEDSLNGVRSALAAGCRTFALRHQCNRMLTYPPEALEIEDFGDPRLRAAVGLTSE